MKTQQQVAVTQREEEQALGPHVASVLEGPTLDLRLEGEAWVPVERLPEMIRQVAAEVWRRWWTEPLSVAEAAAWSGYSENHLYELVSRGVLPDVTPEEHRVRVRRCDLPRKAVSQR